MNYKRIAVAVSLACSGLLQVASAAPIEQTSMIADAGLINEQQILYWMVKRGELSATATDAEKRTALAAYTAKAKSFPTREHHALKNSMKQKLKTRANRQRVNGSVFSDSNDVEKTVKVLAVLVDFPDLPYNDNRLTASDSAMFYDNYPVAHYEKLLFSPSGFDGPQKQNLKSANQYFSAVSGDTFSFTGEVKGWVTAKEDAAFYGGNDADKNDDDKAVPDLVKEAVIAVVADMSEAELNSYDVEDPGDLNNNGITDEPDGIIDHIMLFHSSVGEEAGGGVLGDDAIWSHRFFVQPQDLGFEIPGKNKKIFGYTVQPIDAAAGVCAHEFGHDLGLPDEYDTRAGASDVGSPVGLWSIMSGGSWAGAIPGAEPTGFSPYARSYLQARYEGNWINEQVVNQESIKNKDLDVELFSAVNSEQTNQLSIPLPPLQVQFKTPYAGDYQYYSGEGDQMINSMSFDVTLPSSTSLTLMMKAHWNIEVDYDYVQVLINDTAIVGNHTKIANPQNSAAHIITGDSTDIPESEGAHNWVDLEYDLTSFADSTVTVKIVYITDEFEGEYGFVADNIKVLDGSKVVYQDDAEEVNDIVLKDFKRVGASIEGKPMRYIVQLRSYQGVDSSLKIDSYEPGVLVWLENMNQTDNNVSEHEGQSLIGVIDADQSLIGTRGTSTQVRDATFSKFDQSAFAGDTELSANSTFSDTDNYISPKQPQGGMFLRNLGISLEVIEQAEDSSTTTVRLTRTVEDENNPEQIAAYFSSEINNLK
ncbi:MAG: M6 family metalloprotease domain-containing protein, partial [Shewanella sp.]|nr:M6 family metalloprotease domain-containing protein [Shewanella sp.]